jgi:hypothetical protein
VRTGVTIGAAFATSALTFEETTMKSVAVRALTAAAYRPLAPVDPLALADPEQRRQWQAMRGMQVFSFWDSTNTRPTVDVMLDPIVPFDELWAQAQLVQIGGLDVRLASIPHLIRLKETAGRPQDLADLERLRAKLAEP